MRLFDSIDDFKNSLGHINKFKKVLNVLEEKNNFENNVYYNVDGFLVFKRQTELDKNSIYYENHIKYLDLHYIFKGEQTFEYQDVFNSINIKKYNDETDYSYYSTDEPKKVVVKEGQLILFDSNDIFKMTDSNIVKYVFKITKE